jgi:hypothetical protein
VTIPATVTKSMGLLADAPLSWFLHRHLPIYCTVSNSRRLSGLSHLDNFIVTRNSCPLTGTLQKRMPTPTQTATSHTTGPLAVRQICPKFALHRDFRRARKSLAALPCNRPFAAKHMLFCPPGLRYLESFIVT